MQQSSVPDGPQVAGSPLQLGAVPPQVPPLPLVPPPAVVPPAVVPPAPVFPPLAIVPPAVVVQPALVIPPVAIAPVVPLVVVVPPALVVPPLAIVPPAAVVPPALVVTPPVLAPPVAAPPAPMPPALVVPPGLVMPPFPAVPIAPPPLFEVLLLPQVAKPTLASAARNIGKPRPCLIGAFLGELPLCIILGTKCIFESEVTHTRSQLDGRRKTQPVHVDEKIVGGNGLGLAMPELKRERGAAGEVRAPSSRDLRASPKDGLLSSTRNSSKR